MDKLRITALSVLVSTCSTKERSWYLEFVKSGANPLEVLELTKAEKPEFIVRLQCLINSKIEEVVAWQKQGINTTALGLENYPKKLESIQDPPPVLYYIGELSARLNQAGVVAVIGSRAADQKVSNLAYKISKQAVRDGACIVSGLAYGVDAAAHAGALDAASNYPTVAVLGNGLDRIYPSVHRPLAKKILKSGGALISQFAPGTVPLPHNFLNRNRVIAGLSDAVIVVQAGDKSGSLSTAHNAMEYGRDVLVCPGEFDDERFAGSNKLIKDGAFLISSYNDILEIIPSLHKTTEVEATNDSPAVAKIKALLKDGSMQLSDLRELAALDGFDKILLEMEMTGEIICTPSDEVMLS